MSRITILDALDYYERAIRAGGDVVDQKRFVEFKLWELLAHAHWAGRFYWGKDRDVKNNTIDYDAATQLLDSVKCPE